MRQDRNEYPFHSRQPHVALPAYGYRPVPMKARENFVGTLGKLIGSCAAIAVAVYTFGGFLFA